MTYRVKKIKKNKMIQRENARKKESKRINVVTRQLTSTVENPK